VRRRSRLAQDKLAEAVAFAAEAIGAIRTTQAFGMELPTSQRFSAAAEDAFQAARISTRARALLTGMSIFLVSASVVGVLWYGAQDVLAGSMTAGRLSQFVLYAVFAASALGQLSEVYGELAQAAGSAERLAEILATKPGIVAQPPHRSLPEPSLGTVEFAGVRFAYPTRPEISALEGLSFRVEPGERVALVGPSGAGKSTVFQLLLRFYDPQEGTVLVDGVPVRHVVPIRLRRRMALVPQEPAIFAASVADNIQRQRLAIARAILKDAPILLLDEATSALDAESERAVQDALDHLMLGRTTLVIAHRLATVRAADRILVMDGGRIVEEGTHEMLLARGGLYARLARLQFTEGAMRGEAAE
jgi:ATP-binding cassette subfamily B protein